MRASGSSAAKAIRCAACKKRIRAHEPDAILEDVAGVEKPRFYHERCQSAAYALAMKRPAVYVLTLRHGDPSRS